MLKSIPANSFPGDRGLREPAVEAALGITDASEMLTSLVAALDRVFIAVFPHAKPTDECENPSTELVTIPFPGGGQAVPVFTSAAEVAAFDRGARPVPVYISKAAATAGKECGGRIAIDPSSTHAVWLGRSAVVALAAGVDWTAPWKHDGVLAALRSVAEMVDGVAALELHPRKDGVMMLAVVLEEGVDGEEQLREVLGQVLTAVQSHRTLRAHLDVLEIIPIKGSEM